jgi:hypothetical protein
MRAYDQAVGVVSRRGKGSSARWLGLSGQGGCGRRPGGQSQAGNGQAQAGGSQARAAASSRHAARHKVRAGKGNRALAIKVSENSSIFF